MGETITPSSTPFSRHLGILIDDNLKFDHHVKHAVSKAKPRISVLKAVTGTDWGADIITKRILYCSWVRPLLEWGSLCLSSIRPSSYSLLE
jgi:hypothetical protein